MWDLRGLEDLRGAGAGRAWVPLAFMVRPGELHFFRFQNPGKGRDLLFDFGLK